MSIFGIKSLRYGVKDVPLCTRYFEDFGLSLVEKSAVRAKLSVLDGATVELLHLDDPEIPGNQIQGPGVKEVVWGVRTREDMDILAGKISKTWSGTMAKDEQSFSFVTDFGIPMTIAVWQRKPIVTAPEPANSPGAINRLNTHRKWRRRAYPKVINHVVFQLAQFEEASRSMMDVMGFKLSDIQDGFGNYLRAPASNNHHSLLLLNANAPLPGCDGMLRFHHANFGVEDVDEIMIGANYMERAGWESSKVGLGRHRIDSGLFCYLESPAGGEAEYGADADYVDDAWVPRSFTVPLFGYAHYTHNIPPFLKTLPAWGFRYLTDDEINKFAPRQIDPA